MQNSDKGEQGRGTLTLGACLSVERVSQSPFIEWIFPQRDNIFIFCPRDLCASPEG